MNDPGNIYAIGFAMMFAFAAVVMFFARRSQVRAGEATNLSLKPILALAGASVFMLVAVGAKVVFLADFYNKNSMYAPA